MAEFMLDNIKTAYICNVFFMVLDLRLAMKIEVVVMTTLSFLGCL